MVGRPTGERALYFGAAAVLLLTVGIVILVRRPTAPTTTNTASATARQTYASLYDALWRQDTGRGSTLMTATLFVPPMIAALGQDTQRSQTEEQLWTLLKNAPATSVGIYCTFDSVSGYLTDAEIEKSLHLTSDTGQAFQLQQWTPIIGATGSVNANVEVASQRGLAMFTTETAIDWPAVRQLTLRATNLGDQPIRQFVWTQIGTLLQ